MSLDKMEAIYKCMVKSDLFAIGKMAEKMRIEYKDEYDKDLFKNAETSKYFAIKIH